jgi:hypothetical protein
MKKYLSIALLSGALLMSGCGDSENFVFTGTNNTNVVVAPICVDDAYTTNQDATLTVNAANGVLANDAPNGGTVVAFDATSAQGGTVSVNPDGSFTYTPANSFNGTDSFTYTVRNSGGQVTCTVTIAVQAVNGYFVDAVNGDDGTGSFQGGNPYATIQAAVADAPTNADIVVTSGNYTGGINLKDGQRLLGSGSVLAQGATRPQLTGPVVMANGNTLDFLRIEGTNGDAVDAEGQDSGTVTNCEFANTMAGTNGGDGIDCQETSGNWTISNNTFTTLNGAAFGFATIGTSSATYVYNNNVATGNGLGGWVGISEDSSDVRASAVGNTFRGNNTIAGDAFELICSDNSSFCLDLENNIADTDTNPGNGDDGVYRVGEFNTADLQIEEFSTLTDPQPGGAGNSGTVNDSSTGTIQDVVDGTCGF